MNYHTTHTLCIGRRIADPPNRSRSQYRKAQLTAKHNASRAKLKERELLFSTLQSGTSTPSSAYRQRKQNKGLNEDEIVDVGVDGSLVEFYPNFEEYIREALREVPEIGVWGEKRIRIGIAKDGSGVGAALIALVADKAMKGESASSESSVENNQANEQTGESSFTRPAGLAGYVNSLISYINRGVRHM